MYPQPDEDARRTTWLICLCIIVLFGIGIISCAPAPIEPTAPPDEIELAVLNPNPELLFGGCDPVQFQTDNWGMIHTKQCYPEGYTLHEVYTHGSYPITVNYTGEGYTFMLGGQAGEYGLTTPELALEQGCYLIEFGGLLHVWGKPNEYARHALITANGQIYDLHTSRLPANGNYHFFFPFLLTGETTLTATVMFNMVFGSATADSFATIEWIHVRKVHDDYCDELTPMIGEIK